MTDKELTGKRIQERRKAIGYTQTQLAEKMGYSSRSGINRIESGINKVSAAKLMLFAEVLNTSFDYLTGITDNPKRTILNDASNIIYKGGRKMFNNATAFGDDYPIHDKLSEYDPESKIGKLIRNLILNGDDYSDEDIEAVNKFVDAINYKNHIK